MKLPALHLNVIRQNIFAFSNTQTLLTLPVKGNSQQLTIAEL